MDLLCYLHSGWQPEIRPAPSTRPWMDALPESFGYRCLPLTIANSHGWELLNPCSFDAYWTGGSKADDVVIKLRSDEGSGFAPVPIFGNGVLTFHVAGIFRTPPGWNLWIGGSPNRIKDGIAPLTGVVETDWSPFTFTMNWRFTRPDHVVRFEAGEPFGFIFPVQRSVLEAIEPKYLSLEDAPETMAQFQAWSRSRDAFHADIARNPPQSAGAKWQKHYFRGFDMDGHRGAADHRTKLRLRPFAPGLPSAASPATAEVDADDLVEVLVEVAKALRDGDGAAALTGRMAGLGLPTEVAEKVVAAASRRFDQAPAAAS